MATMEPHEEKHNKLKVRACFSYHAILSWAVFAENVYISVDGKLL